MNIVTPTKPSVSGLSSILESSNVDPAAAAAATVLVGGGAAFLTSLLGSFLPSFDSSKEIEERSEEDEQLIDRITSYTKQKTYSPKRPPLASRPIRRRNPPKQKRPRPRNPVRHKPVPKRNVPPIRGIQNNHKRYQTTPQQLPSLNRNDLKEDDETNQMSTSRIPSLPVRVVPEANVQTGYAQVIKQQRNGNENSDNLSGGIPYPINSIKDNNGTSQAYNTPADNYQDTLYGTPGIQEENVKHGYVIDYDDEETTNPLRAVSPEVIDMFCREAVVLSEEKLRNELMTVDSFSYRLLKLIQKYHIPMPQAFIKSISERKLDEDRNEANAKQARIVMMLDKTCNGEDLEGGYEDQNLNHNEQYVVSSVYSEEIEGQDQRKKIKHHSPNHTGKHRPFANTAILSNMETQTHSNDNSVIEMPFLTSEKEGPDYGDEPELELITAHPNMQHIGEDFNAILSANAPNAPASAVVVTSGFT